MTEIVTPVTDRFAEPEPRLGWATWRRALWANAYFYKRLWRSSVTSSLLFPVLYLAAMGLGLGKLVNQHSGGVGGVTYVAYIAPGLLAGTVMQVSINESMYPVMAAIKWTRSYWSMLATPLSVTDILIGHLGWIGLRMGLVSSFFLGVMVLFGLVHSPLALLIPLVAVLCGVACAGPVSGYAASTTNESGFAMFYRFVVIPLFLFSGTFFPIASLPAWLRPIAWATPLSNATSLCRAFSLGNVVGWVVVANIAVLCVYAIGGWTFALSRYRRRLCL